MTDGKSTVGLYADVPTWLKYELERLALERSRNGDRVTLRKVVTEALTAYVRQNGGQVPDDANQADAGQGSAE